MMKKLCAFTIDTYTKRMFVRGLRDGFPIGLGYLAVSFALGIAARRAGLDVLAAAIMSLTNLTSAGQAAGITLIAAGTTVAEMALTQLVINLRYLLMSCALSQKVSPQTPWYHRMLVSFGITDELFALQAARPGTLCVSYAYGALSMAVPGWTLGTVLGVCAGNLLPAMLTDALGVCLYGMFIAAVVPSAKKDRHVTLCALCAMAFSALCTYLPQLSSLSEGLKICLVTVVVSSLAALFFPVPENKENLSADTAQTKDREISATKSNHTSVQASSFDAENNGWTKEDGK